MHIHDSTEKWLEHIEKHNYVLTQNELEMYGKKCTSVMQKFFIFFSKNSKNFYINKAKKQIHTLCQQYLDNPNHRWAQEAIRKMHYDSDKVRFIKIVEKNATTLIENTKKISHDEILSELAKHTLEEIFTSLRHPSLNLDKCIQESNSATELISNIFQSAKPVSIKQPNTAIEEEISIQEVPLDENDTEDLEQQIEEILSKKDSLQTAFEVHEAHNLLNQLQPSEEKDILQKKIEGKASQLKYPQDIHKEIATFTTTKDKNKKEQALKNIVQAVSCSMTQFIYVQEKSSITPIQMLFSTTTDRLLPLIVIQAIQTDSLSLYNTFVEKVSQKPSLLLNSSLLQPCTQNQVEQLKGIVDHLNTVQTQNFPDLVFTLLALETQLTEQKATLPFYTTLQLLTQQQVKKISEFTRTEKAFINKKKEKIAQDFDKQADICIENTACILAKMLLQKNPSTQLSEFLKKIDPYGKLIEQLFSKHPQLLQPIFAHLQKEYRNHDFFNAYTTTIQQLDTLFENIAKNSSEPIPDIIKIQSFFTHLFQKYSSITSYQNILEIQLINSRMSYIEKFSLLKEKRNEGIVQSQHYKTSIQQLQNITKEIQNLKITDETAPLVDEKLSIYQQTKSTIEKQYPILPSTEKLGFSAEEFHSVEEQLHKTSWYQEKMKTAKHLVGSYISEIQKTKTIDPQMLLSMRQQLENILPKTTALRSFLLEDVKDVFSSLIGEFITLSGEYYIRRDDETISGIETGLTSLAKEGHPMASSLQHIWNDFTIRPSNKDRKLLEIETKKTLYDFLASSMQTQKHAEHLTEMLQKLNLPNWCLLPVQDFTQKLKSITQNLHKKIFNTITPGISNELAELFNKKATASKTDLVFAMNELLKDKTINLNAAYSVLHNDAYNYQIASMAWLRLTVSIERFTTDQQTDKSASLIQAIKERCGQIRSQTMGGIPLIIKELLNCCPAENVQGRQQLKECYQTIKDLSKIINRIQENSPPSFLLDIENSIEKIQTHKTPTENAAGKITYLPDPDPNKALTQKNIKNLTRTHENIIDANQRKMLADMLPITTFQVHFHNLSAQDQISILEIAFKNGIDDKKYAQALIKNLDIAMQKLPQEEQHELICYMLIHQDDPAVGKSYNILLQHLTHDTIDIKNRNNFYPKELLAHEDILEKLPRINTMITYQQRALFARNMDKQDVLLNIQKMAIKDQISILEVALKNTQITNAHKTILQKIKQAIHKINDIEQIQHLSYILQSAQDPQAGKAYQTMLAYIFSPN